MDCNIGPVDTELTVALRFSTISHDSSLAEAKVNVFLASFLARFVLLKRIEIEIEICTVLVQIKGFQQNTPKTMHQKAQEAVWNIISFFQMQPGYSAANLVQTRSNHFKNTKKYIYSFFQMQPGYSAANLVQIRSKLLQKHKKIQKEQYKNSLRFPFLSFVRTLP